ncbi:MAG TPA: hypothetical protein VJ782_01275, partial [Aeromicrobium sp.]|nr:hypothetical protein [Aeromicrobium sp.]
MTAAARFGVRLRETSEMRRVSQLAGILWLTFATGGFSIQLSSRHWLLHPDAHLALQITSAGIGLVALLFGLLMSASFLERWWAPAALALFAASIVGLELAMVLTNYPDSGFIAIACPVIAILAFYVLVRWMAA